MQKNEIDRCVSQMMMVRVLSKGIARLRGALDLRYHPERHYMRGPGPACRRKQQLEARRRQSEQSTDAGRPQMTPQFAPEA